MPFAFHWLEAHIQIKALIKYKALEWGAWTQWHTNIFEQNCKLKFTLNLSTVKSPLVVKTIENRFDICQNYLTWIWHKFKVSAKNTLRIEVLLFFYQGKCHKKCYLLWGNFWFWFFFNFMFGKYKKESHLVICWNKKPF